MAKLREVPGIRPYDNPAGGWDALKATAAAVYDQATSTVTLRSHAQITALFDGWDLVDPGLAVIDINAAFADGHRSGVLSEELTVASLIQTLSANLPGILKVKILVEGKQRDTLAGHADLSGFFDVAAVNLLTSQLQSSQ